MHVHINSMTEKAFIKEWIGWHNLVLIIMYSTFYAAQRYRIASWKWTRQFLRFCCYNKKMQFMANSTPLKQHIIVLRKMCCASCDKKQFIFCVRLKVFSVHSRHNSYGSWQLAAATAASYGLGSRTCRRTGKPAHIFFSIHFLFREININYVNWQSYNPNV